MPHSRYVFLVLMLFSQLVSGDIGLPDGEGPWVIKAQYPSKNHVLSLKSDFDFWRIDEKNQTVLMMVESHAEYRYLESMGFKMALDEALMEQQRLIREKQRAGTRTIDGFPCYRTVAETYTEMNTMNSTYPGLVELVDIGDSWHKQEAGGLPGHDMQVVKITNESITTPDKPIMFAMGSIHSREYPPAELVTRFAEHLLAEYGNDPDVTWLIDHHEIHLLLQGNPDGREISENEASPNQRKNRNENFCSSGGGQQGVDMNRNFLFKWNEGVCNFGCSSGNACSQVFRGDSSLSEPETIAINTYIQTLFPDERDDDLIDAAPMDKPGVYLDIHNVAELTLFPWGFSDNPGQAPNHDQLQTLARKMSFYTGYRAEQSSASLGGADGASDDNAYGTLGVAAFTIELGEGGFYSSCTAFENTIYPDNLQAMIYAAKASRMPYVLASGPNIIDLPGGPAEVSAGASAQITGTATDLQFNNNNGTEATQNITGVKAYVDTPSWLPGAVAIDLVATDGSFNSTSEGFTASLDTTGWSTGRHVVWFEGTDAAGVTGVPSAVFIDVVNPGDLGTLSGTVRDADDNTPIEGATVMFNGEQINTAASGQYSIQTSPATADMTVSKPGYTSFILQGVVLTAGNTTTQDVNLAPMCHALDENVESYAVGPVGAGTGGWQLITEAGSNDWRIEGGDDQSNAGNGKAFVSTDVATATDKSLVSPPLVLSTDVELVFWHKHDFESGNANYDGGVIEITTNAGGNWTDLGGEITQNGYNGTLDGGFGQPLGAVPAFVDNLGTFTEVKVDLSNYTGQTAQIRWRMGTDNTQAAGDWKIDNIQVLTPDACQTDTDLIFEDGFE